MENVDIEALLEARSSELKEIADAAAKGDHEKLTDAAAGLAISLATGNPVLAALAPLARKGIACAFGNAADKMFERELAAMTKQEERDKFLGQIDEVVAALVGQAIVQLVRTQHRIKDETLEALGGLREDFETFRCDFSDRLNASGHVTVEIAKQVVSDGAVGIRVRNQTTQRVTLAHQMVAGKGSVGVVLG